MAASPDLPPRAAGAYPAFTSLLKLMTITPDELLESTSIGCGLHQWGVDGGSIQVATNELRPALEQAYDPSMPDWPNLISWDDEDGFFAA